MLRILFYLLVGTSSLSAQTLRCYYDDPRGPARSHTVDYHNLLVDIDIDPHQQKVSGRAELQFSPLREVVDSLWLDAPGINIKSVRQHGKKLRFEMADGGIFVFARESWKRNETHIIEVQYEAWPRKGLYFSGWDSDGLYGQVWSQGQGIDNRHWIPHFDGLNNKLTTELIVRFDSAYQVVSNGDLRSKEPVSGGRCQWHWKMDKPHSSYLIMLAIGNFKYFDSQSVSGVDICQYYYPEWENNKHWIYKHTEDMMDWLESETMVPYPWANYKQVPIRDFIYGAMENTTATIFKDVFYTDSVHFDFRNYLFINTHEMAHQWFGNYITAWSPQHHWLQESFATYYHQKVQEELISPDQYDEVRYQSAMMARYTSLSNPYPLAHADAGTGRHYQKGSLVLAMLEDWVGIELFRESLAYYLRRHAFDNVRSQNLMDAFHRVTGHSMDQFWDQWVYRPGEPFLQVDVRVQEKKRKTEGYWLIFSQDSSRLKDSRLFYLPVKYEVVPRKGDPETRVFHLKTERDSVWVEGDIRYVIVDPRKVLLAHWKMNLPKEWWEAQFTGATFAIDRKMAFRNCEDCKVTFDIAAREPFGPLRAFWLSEAVKDTLPAEELFRWVGDPYFSVRKQAYEAVVNLPQPIQIEWYRIGVNDAHEEIRAYCMNKLLPFLTTQELRLLMSELRPATDDFDMGVFRWEWYKARIKQLDIGEEAELRREIERYLQSRYPGDWRLAAMELVAENNWWSDENIIHLLKGYVHYDRGYRAECNKQLQHLMQKEPDRVKRLMDDFEKKATVQQREKLTKLRDNE
jgi:hypothetical protein